MLTTLIVVLVSCAAMILLVFFKPAIKVGEKAFSIYWAAPLLGALALIIVGSVSLRTLFSALTEDSEINPLKILILFLSMTLISILLDNTGFFSMLARFALTRARGSQRRLFLYLYALVSVLTVFTSNDIIVLTFTPFICYFAKNAKIKPLPYLICEFVAANTWSMALMIGNPTNIYLATGAGIGFLSYARIMLLPTCLAGITSLLVLLAVFGRALSQPLSREEIPPVKIDKGSMILGIVHLAVCIMLMAASSFLHIAMWLVSFVCCISLFVCVLLYQLLHRHPLIILRDTLHRAPWEIVPFVLSMFVLVLALENVGATELISAFLNKGNTLVNYGVSSFAVANLVNNIPMSVLFSSVISFLSGEAYRQALFASIVGSNLGAFFTPMGALAGIMWMGLLKAHDVPMSFGKFIRYGAAAALPALIAALAGLMWVL